MPAIFRLPGVVDRAEATKSVWFWVREADEDLDSIPIPEGRDEAERNLAPAILAALFEIPEEPESVSLPPKF